MGTKAILKPRPCKPSIENHSAPEAGHNQRPSIPRVWQFAIRWKTSLLLMSCTFRLRTKYCYSLCLRIKPHISITNIVFFTTINTITRDFPRFFPASYLFRPGVFPTSQAIVHCGSTPNGGRYGNAAAPHRQNAPPPNPGAAASIPL